MDSRIRGCAKVDRAPIVLIVEIEGVRTKVVKVRSILRRVRVTVSRKRTVRRYMEQRMSSVSAEEMPSREHMVSVGLSTCT